MQVQAINGYNAQNNRNSNPNFTSIKKIGVSGLYKKAPDEAQKLLETFKENPVAMDFCRKYDVRIYFHAMKDFMDNVESSIHIFFDNPAKNKFKKFWQAINNSEDRITITAHGYSLKDSTNDLIRDIEPYINGNDSRGILNSHLNANDNIIQETLKNKEAKKLAKQMKKQEKIETQVKANEQQNKLNDLTQDLINATK